MTEIRNKNKNEIGAEYKLTLLRVRIKALRTTIETSLANQLTRMQPLLDNYIDSKSLHSILLQTENYRENTNASIHRNQQIYNIITRTLQNKNRTKPNENTTQDRLNKTPHQINNSHND